MPDPAPRILLAAPDESLIRAFYQAVPKDEHSILALNVLEQPAATVVEYARTSSIEVIISRGGVAEFLREAQKEDPDAIPIVQIQVSPFDIVDAVREARKISRNMAFIAYANMLEGIKKIAEIIDLDVRFISRSSPWDCLESVFTALEHKAEVIVGDARVVKICGENKIPCVPLSSGEESLRQAFLAARRLIVARDASRRETRRLTAILDHLDQGLLALNGEGRVLYSNARADALAGVGKKQLLGLDIRQIPLFRHHFTPSFFLNGTGRSVFVHDENKREYLARWKKVEPQTFGIGGVITLEAGREGLAPALTDRGDRGHAARFSFEDIVGTSPALQKAKDKARRYAQADAAVLLQGQTGVGKELFAHAIHNAGPRRDEPFVAVNLAALPITLMESELFGYVRGAFTDARREGKQGVFEYAGKGTVFLDEIGESPPEMQSRLLRVLQDGEFMRLGDDKRITAHCRIIAATNKVLEDAVRRGAFREDLYYRLNILSLHIPGLNERREDIRALAQVFLKKFCAQYGKAPGRISPRAMKLLLERAWSGNIRELQAVMQRHVVLCEEKRADLDESGLRDILEEDGQAGRAPRPRCALVDEEIQLALKAQHGNINAAAAALGVHRSTLWRRLKKRPKQTQPGRKVVCPAPPDAYPVRS